MAQRWVQAERLAPAELQAAGAQAVREAQRAARVSAAQPQAAPEVWDVAVVPQPAAEPAAAVRRREVAAVQDVAAVRRRAVGLASVAVRPRGAAALDAGVLRRAARDAQAVLLLAAAWAALPSTRCRGARLRHLHGRGLRMRGERCELRSRERGSGKQHEAKVCHDHENPRKSPEQQTRCLLAERIGTAINRQPLGRIVAAYKCAGPFISAAPAPECTFVHCTFRCLARNGHIVPDGSGPGRTSGSEPGKSEMPASVAGYGVRGPCGPRTGNSSGARPGNSRGCGGAPGSRTGGGISGRGFPGGSSCGGSVGFPGVAGGTSGGSIGI